MVLAEFQERLGPLQAWLFPRRLYLEIQDQVITAMALSGRRLIWFDQLRLPPGLCSGGRLLNGPAMADQLGDWLVQRGYAGARIWAVLPGAASEVRLLKGSAPAKLMHKEFDALRLPWPAETAVDLLHVPLPSCPGSSVAVAVEEALLEEWIDAFADAGLVLDAMEAAPVCALRSIGLQTGWLLGLEPEQSWLFRLEKGAPTWQWRLPPPTENGALRAELDQCLSYWQSRAPQSSSISVVASAALPASVVEALRMELQWIDPLAAGALQNGLPDQPEFSLALLWGMAMSELQP